MVGRRQRGDGIHVRLLLAIGVLGLWHASDPSCSLGQVGSPKRRADADAIVANGNRMRFPTLGDVVSHYDRHLSLGLTEAQSRDLVEYLKSL